MIRNGLCVCISALAICMVSASIHAQQSNNAPLCDVEENMPCKDILESMIRDFGLQEKEFSQHCECRKEYYLIWAYRWVCDSDGDDAIVASPVSKIWVRVWGEMPGSFSGKKNYYDVPNTNTQCGGKIKCNSECDEKGPEGSDRWFCGQDPFVSFWEIPDRRITGQACQSDGQPAGGSSGPGGP